MNMTPRTIPAASQQVLDPCHLGRPVHLLPVFTAALRDDLAEAFRTGMNRRYRAAFQVGEVSMSCTAESDPSARWWTCTGPVGAIGFTLERSVLLAALHYRYGAGDRAGATPDAPVRETATEERLAAMLGQQLVGTLATRIDGAPGAATDAPSVPAVLASGPPPAGAWTIRVEISETTLGIQGVLRFALDEPWMSRLLHRLVAARPRPKEAGASGKPLVARLQVRLAGRLLRKEIALGELLGIRIGDVIPVSLGATDVLVDDSRLFRAVVAERSGKLCLTSFEDVE